VRTDELKIKGLSRGVKKELLKMTSEEWEEFREFIKERR
jgi:hypothetical protein